MTLAAGIATLKEAKEKDAVKHMWEMGKLFQDGFNEILTELNLNFKVVGYPPRQNIVFCDLKYYTVSQIKTLF